MANHIYNAAKRNIADVLPGAFAADEQTPFWMTWDRSTPRPHVGSRWTWMPGTHAAVNVEVTAVDWNGEEWWVWVRDIKSGRVYPNEAERFWEAVLA